MEKIGRLVEVPFGAPVNEYLRKTYPFLTSEYVYYTLTIFNNNPRHVFVEVFGKPVTTLMDAVMVRKEMERVQESLW